MNLLEILILVLIGGYVAYILFVRKKKTGCGGNCGLCHGCDGKEKPDTYNETVDR